MKIVKLKNDIYFPSHVDGYNKFRVILKTIFMGNKNSPTFKYLGCRSNTGIKGILVSGLGSQSIRTFDKFYSTHDIMDLIRDGRLRE